MKQSFTRLCESLFYQREGPCLIRYLKNFRKLLFWIFFAAGAVADHRLSEWEDFQLLVARGNDSMARADAQKHAIRSDYIRVVEIQKEDFYREFGGQRPLDPHKLSSVILGLAIRCPKALVVDLDTSDPKYAQVKIPDKIGFPIIWARTGERVSEDESKVDAQRVLGGRFLPEGNLTGMTTAYRDLDWSLREYPRCVSTTHQTHAKTLAWMAYCELRPKDVDCTRTVCGNVIFDRFFDFARFSVSEFPPDTRAAFTTRRCIDDPRISGKIVILGESYSSDGSLATPFGMKTPAEVVAMALAEEFYGPYFHKISPWCQLFCDVILALIIVAIHTVMRPIPALVTSLGLSTLLMWVGVWIVLEVLHYQVSFIAFMLGIIIEQLAVGTEQAHHLVREREELTELINQAHINYSTLNKDVEKIAEDPASLASGRLLQELVSKTSQFAHALKHALKREG